MDGLRVAVRKALSHVQLERCSGDDVLGELLRRVDGCRAEDFPDEQAAAAAVHCSPSTLRRKVRGALGLDYREFRRSLVMAAACDALRDRSRAIKEIAHSAGYQSESSFTRAFHTSQRLTPREFRARGMRSPR